MMIPMRCMLGVDEAGRGPLAGPVAVGVTAVAEGFDVMREFPGVADSKKLSEKQREKIFEMLETRVSAGDARFAVEFESAETIDEEGIAVAVRRALARGVNALADEIGHPMSQGHRMSNSTFSSTARSARRSSMHKKPSSTATNSSRSFHLPLSRRRLSATDVWWNFPNNIRCMDLKSIRATVRRCIMKC